MWILTIFCRCRGELQELWEGPILRNTQRGHGAERGNEEEEGIEMGGMQSQSGVADTHDGMDVEEDSGAGAVTEEIGRDDAEERTPIPGAQQEQEVQDVSAEAEIECEDADPREGDTETLLQGRRLPK
jgi:hypothetical protein